MKRHKWHVFVFLVLRVFANPLLRFTMGFRCGREKMPDTPSMIIANHNTDLDPALVALGLSRHMYFVASEHAFRKGFFSKVLRFLFAPIPINKLKTDVPALKEILQRLKSGCNVCVFAEGNRSYNGLTGGVSISTAKLVKHSGASLITYRLEGGYLTTPRWAKNKRKGKLTGRIVGLYSASELKAMTDRDILRTMERDIHEDAYERQKEKPVCYRGKTLAEHIEIALYLCPGCGKMASIHSNGDHFSCTCGLRATYTETGFLKGDALPFSTVADWDRWQAARLAEIVGQTADGPICGDDHQKLFLLRPTAGATLVGEGPLRMDREALQCAGRIFPIRQITRVAIVDRMTLLFALRDGTQYEVISAVPRSALKYMEIYRILCQPNT